MEFPKLVEPNVQNYLYNTLQKCHETKSTIYGWLYNGIGFILVFSIIGITLYLCRKRKLTPYEQSEKMRKEQEYVLSKIRHYKSTITDLPHT